MAMGYERWRRVGVSLLMMVTVFSSSSFSSPLSSSLKVKSDNPCSGSGCCRESNCDPGPLNLSTPRGGFDARLEGEKTFIYHCLRYFTSFHWYRLHPQHHDDLTDDGFDDNDTRLEPYPWGQRGHVQYVEDRGDNQTVVISGVRREDQGVYVFVASNGTHRVSGKFTLQVDCLDTGPSFATTVDPVQVVAVGSNKTLPCAVNLADCEGKFYDSNVFWVWHNFTSGSMRMLKNFTFQSLSVVCDRGLYFGGKCDVLIRHVEQEMFHGEFVCKMADRDELNMTVRLVPVRTDVKTWLPYVLGVAGGVVALLALVGVTWWRYGHRIEFFCRSQPSRGNYEADAAILHGEDHEELVRETLLPKVKALGYGVLEEVTRPGRLELPENLNAVDNSYSVILTFSANEIAEDGQVAFLHRYVFTRKAPSSVIFIRCADNENRTEDSSETPSTRRSKNPWKNEALQSFKILDLPQSLRAGSSQDRSLRKARDEEKFWYSVQKHLPKIPPGSTRQKRTPDVANGNAGRNTSSTASHRPLIDSDSAERSSLEVSDSRTLPPRTPDIEAEETHNENESPPSYPAESQTSRMSPTPGPQPSAGPTSAGHRHESLDDDVFVSVSAGNSQSTTTPTSTPAGAALIPSQGRSAEPGDSQPRSEPADDVRDQSWCLDVKGSSPQNYAGSADLPQQESACPQAETLPSPTSPPTETSSRQPQGKPHPRQTSLDILGEGGLGEGRLGPPCEEIGSPCDESSALLQSQESGYHSPGSHTEVTPFGQGLGNEARA